MTTWDLKNKKKIGVTSAHFRLKAKFADSIGSFNSQWMKSVENSAFSFMILVGTSLFWEVLDMSKDLFFFKALSRFKVSKLKECFHDKNFLLL